MSDIKGTPTADVEIDSALVRSLLEAQHPDLAHYSLELMGAGWDNTMFKLGDALVVRLPRRLAAANLIRHEQNWLPQIAHRLTLPAPVPIRIGQPSERYPWRWSVLPWIEGETADQLAIKPAEADRFGLFLRSLHTLAPTNAPRNPFRGVPLAARSRKTQPILNKLARSTSLMTPRIKQLWQDALSAPASTEQRWLHGDLHPRNVLVNASANNLGNTSANNGTISGIIDWGDMTSGDVATDLAAIWMLFPTKPAQHSALARYGASQAEIKRGQGWAITFAALLLETGLVDNPRNAAIGRSILANL